jgi:tetratricopeptide (TPR) repeat protein
MKRFAVAPLIYLVAIIAAAYIAGTTARADDAHQHHFDANEKLGDVSFPTSCAPAVQKSFERGVALLHSFAYPEAEHEFEQVAAGDPHCAMAYWGEAMSQYYQLWVRPHADVLKHGADLLQKANAVGAKTPRERDYIHALSAFYSDTDVATHDKRAAAYTAEMAKVHERYPADDEASAFYALALIASAPPADRSLANLRKASDILNAIIPRHPNHPGALHYLIHACDNPQLAPMALDAARRYGDVAASSAHAVHMPSHIFARLGYWQDDIHANLASVEASKRPGAEMASESALHAEDFLTYAYLQIGENDKAKQTIAATAKDMGHSSSGMEPYHEEMRTHLPSLFALETRDWAGALALRPPAGISSQAEAITYWAHAVAAGHLHDQAAARNAVEQYKAALETTKKGKHPYAAEGMQHDLNEALAWQAFADNRIDDAVRQMREVADEQDAVGKGEVELPAREMLADMLLEAKRYDEALTAYKTSMKVDPNRFNGLYGAARAAQGAGHTEQAAEYYAKLVENCGSSHQRPELAEARAALSQAKTVGGAK